MNRIAAVLLLCVMTRLSEERSSSARSTALSGLTHGLHELVDLSVDSEELAYTSVVDTQRAS